MDEQEECGEMKVLITGGAGFIGSNLAHYHLRRGNEVVIFDNMSRKGTDRNLAWLHDLYGDGFEMVLGDIRDFDALVVAIPPDVERVYHMAGQVAVTTSVSNPREDFEINALGTFNVLEAIRIVAPQAIVFYASTNKVYGGLENIEVVEEATRYRYRNHPNGISEDQVLDFYSPFGCSKGSGDQYVRDYARIYNLRTVVMRQSSIYGTRQLGVEEQDWMAHVCITALLGRPIYICGNGKQVHDVLWIDDLIAAYEAAAARINVAAGQVYNIGGGPENTVSIWAEFGPALEMLVGHRITVVYGSWQPGEQLIYVSDIRKAARDLGWRPRVSLAEGLVQLWNWIEANPTLFSEQQTTQQTVTVPV
jgi:CDP-paratose 2-epimerase